MDQIPPEIITNILLRLPAKSLAKFMCVSNNWLAVISEPQFIETHQNTINRHHLICDSTDTSLYSLPFNQLDEKPNNLRLKFDVFVFHGSCNGLVLASADDFVSTHSLVVFNPTTRKLFELPDSGFETVNDLLEIDIMYGFGYDSSTDDYKVVTVSYFHYNYLIPPDNMYVHVYNLRSNNWRRVTDSPYDHSHGSSLPGVFVDGFLHWVAGKGCDCSRVIVGFSLQDEMFSEVLSPDLGDGDCKLVVVGEKLGVLLKDEVWLMNEYGVRESWSKIIIHGFDELRIPMVDSKILYDDGKILLVSGGLMWIYDVEERSFCETIDVSRNMKGLKVKGSYVESLVWPKFR